IEMRHKLQPRQRQRVFRVQECSLLLWLLIRGVVRSRSKTDQPDTSDHEWPPHVVVSYHERYGDSLSLD
ncbi:hypothetical protein HAX54_038729, partial [Datura stramonium]|nr:hypothetical protein [Datura stramonium]